MRRLLALLALCFLAGAPVAHAQSLQFFSASSTTPVGYTGLGDQAPITGDYGLRALTAAQAAAATQPLINVNRASDNHTCDIIAATNGGLGVTANCSTSGDNAQSASAFCNASICTIDEFYDLTGNGRPLLQATVANQPTLVFNCKGSLPCWQEAGASISAASASNFTPATGTVSFTAVSNRVSGNTVLLRENGTTNANRITLTTNGPALAGVTFLTYPILTVDNQFHVSNGVMNSGLSVLNIDGEESTGGIIGSTTAGTINLTGTAAVTTQLTEVAFADNTAWTLSQRQRICANQAASYGVTSTCNSIVPAVAASAGFNTETFSTTSFNTTNTDSNFTLAPGYQWYSLDCFGSTLGAPLHYTFNGDGSIQLGANGVGPAWISTFNCSPTGSPYWHGTAFGGGFYWQATMSFASGTSGGNPFPSMWTQSIESWAQTGGANTGARWPGQGSTYDIFEEVDVIEYMNVNFSSDRCSHNWYGAHTSGFNWANKVDSCDFPTQASNYFTTSHDYGLLWIPATSSTSGSLTWYVDGAPVKTMTWAQFVLTNCQNNATQCPPPTSPWTPGVIDSNHMPLIFEGGNQQPNTISNVQVWQVDGTHNITQ